MKKGFTLVELLVSISIIMILAGITVANYASVRTSSRIDDDISKLVIALRNAQSRSLSPDKSQFNINPSTNVLCGVGVRAGGALDPSQIELVVSSGADCSLVNITRYDLVELENSEFDGLTDYMVIFGTPFGNTKITRSNGTATTANPAIFKLQSTIDTTAKEVWVYSSGLIDVK